MGNRLHEDETDEEIEQRLSDLRRDLEAVKAHRPNVGIADLLIEQKEIKVTLAYQDKDIKKLVRAVEGNGKPGLRREMDVVLARQNQFDWIAKIVIGSALLILIRSIATLLGLKY